MYPILFEGDYKERVWGGQKLDTVLNKNIPYKHTGESWELACHKNGHSTIKNGRYSGLTLEAALLKEGDQLIGKPYKKTDKFPLLIKIIDAETSLSVQVHPDDAYAAIHENGELGKSEAWIIMEADPGAELVIGLKDGVTKADFAKALADNQVESVLNSLAVRPGDVINIPAGLVHAIGGGILLAEVQQNSDTTYRVYDWNRVGLDGKGRELHVDKSLATIDFDGKHSKEKTEGVAIAYDTYTHRCYVVNEYFALEEIINREETILDRVGDYEIYVVLEGKGQITGNFDTLSVRTGDTFMIPNSLNQYGFKGHMKLLKTYVPNGVEETLKRLEAEGLDVSRL